MCGIFAYIGNKQVLELLLTALQRLEYRGYDSAGVGIHQDDHIKIVKKIGKVANLANACGGSRSTDLAGTAGLSHTRWATHGKPSDENSHPHFSEDRYETATPSSSQFPLGQLLSFITVSLRIMRLSSRR
jgi:glucosamine--fructose-6-phosphate aminotransferase (isomerizing)